MNNFIKKIYYKLGCGAKKVGEDEFFNQYFLTKNNKRIVIYNGINEPSKIPMNWHLWIHYSSNEIPKNNSQNTKYSWQKIHLPNLTGTSNAFNPKNHESSKSTQIHHSWQPK